MKKIFLCFILATVLAIKVEAADYYFVGVDAFNKGVYDKAAANLEHAIRISPQNVNARYYLAQVYLKQKRNSDALEEYNRIIYLAPDSDAALLSEKGLYLISNSYKNNNSGVSVSGLDQYKDNYFDYVLPFGGKTVCKWKSFPVAVYIEPDPLKLTVQKAFEQWQNKSNNLVSFNFVTSISQAKIIVKFQDKLEDSATSEGFVAGASKPYYEGGYLSKSEISILTVDPNSHQNLDENFILATALHEIGHSLGFDGHSPQEGDVMFAMNKSVKLELTQRDLNTLNVFYKADKKTMSARGNSQTDLRLAQALEYTSKFPDKAVGWAQLGDYYNDKKMYADAIKNYNKAISIKPQEPNYYALVGNSYLGNGDTANAYKNFKTACDMDKKNPFYLYQFANFCLKTGNKEVGKSYLDAYLKSNAQGNVDEKLQKLINEYR